MSKMRMIMMGNEAIAYGALRAGISVATGYPGTPSSEVLETLFRLIKEKGIKDIYVEWSVNERVAFEIALGAALGGVRSLVTMKAPGANVASDPLLSSAYSGINGGMVVLVADDPGPYTTQTEQDSRWFGDLAKLPIVEPGDPQEAVEFTCKAFELSESLHLPVILRTTTRVNHTVSDVEVEEIVYHAKRASFSPDPKRYIRAIMAWNRERHGWVLDRLLLAEEFAEKLSLNKIFGTGEEGVVTAGVVSNYVLEAVEGKNYEVLKLGLIHPLPRRILTDFLLRHKKVLVVEDIDPYIERGIRVLLQEKGLSVDVRGKGTGDLPKVGEVRPEHVEAALFGPREVAPVVELPTRAPPFCAGCPHIGSFFAIRRGIIKAGYKKEEIPVFGDIGCYALSVNPPFEQLWTENNMGASISMAMGLKMAGFERPVMAVIGDSTFYHSGVLSMLDVAHKNADVLVVILDNGTVAMTGHQSTLSTAVSESERIMNPVSLEKMVESMNVEVAVIDPYRIKEMADLVAKMLKERGPRIIIARRECSVLKRRRGIERVFTVNAAKCRNCRTCASLLACLALRPLVDRMSIMVEDCMGCGMCAELCPFGAIEEVPVS